MTVKMAATERDRESSDTKPDREELHVEGTMKVQAKTIHMFWKI